MRLPTTFAFLTALSAAAIAAPTWQTISSEPGKKIELDRTSIKREGDIVTALGRVVLDKEIIDSRTGAGFRVIEATTRYDCVSRNSNTIKRTYKRNEADVLRSEDLKAPQLPVRAGTLDDKVLREVCRPEKSTPINEVARKANEAAAELKAANEKLIQKELAASAKAQPVKVSDKGPAMIPSIRPNLKAEAEAAKQQAAASPVQPQASPPAPKAAPPAAPATVAVPAPAPTAPAPVAKGPASTTPTYKAATVTVRATSPARKPRKAAPGENYMLELAPPPTHVAATEAVATIRKAPVAWSYEGEGGPENWASIDPKNTLCGQGQRQSPIDIRDGIRVDLEPISFQYRPSYFRVQDIGRTIQVKVGDNAISLTGKTYELSHIEFHRPSEERINGQRFDMSAHLVHRADDGQIAIIAILLERGAENPFIQTIWNNLPLERHLTVQPPDTPIDLMTLLPTLRNYYTYMGSLTTPPCSEGVLWLVMKHSVPVSQEQVNIFSRFYPNNARPTQPAAGRTIKEGR